MVGGRVRRRRIEPRPPTMCASVPSLRAADTVSLAQRETGPQRHNRESGRDRVPTLAAEPHKRGCPCCVSGSNQRHDTSCLPPSLSRGSYTSNHVHRPPGASSEAHIAARSHRDHRRCRDRLRRHRPHPLPSRSHQPDPRMVPDRHRGGGLVCAKHDRKPAGYPCGLVLWWGHSLCVATTCRPACGGVSVCKGERFQRGLSQKVGRAPAAAVADLASLGQNALSAGNI